MAQIPTVICLVAWALLCSMHLASARSIEPPKPLILPDYHHRELFDIETVDYNATVEFFANDTWAHYRTESAVFPAFQCIQYRYAIEGKRTRLRLWLCRMNEGGRCELWEKFRSHSGNRITGCAFLMPWMAKPDHYAVHIQFERRPRKFSDKLKEERWRRRRNGRAAHRQVGLVALEGSMKCSKVCMDF